MTTRVEDILDSAKKSRRVRTGCLTCRDRHIKCDEGLPQCSNCRKSSRTCERGVRLNYQGLKSHSRPCLPPGEDWSVEFLDESRKVASGYLGGLQRYSRDKAGMVRVRTSDLKGRKCRIVSDSDIEVDCQSQDFASINWNLDVDDLSSVGQSRSSQTQTLRRSDKIWSDISREAETQHTKETYARPRCQTAIASPTNGEVDFLGSLEEIDYMQAFVEEVGVWMDLFDAGNHFSELIPHQALKSPMLRNAVLSCGAKQLSLRSGQGDEPMYYNTATSQLKQLLDNPERDMVECATAAVILNVHEMMCGARKMYHAEGARTLVQQNDWDGNSTGFGGACFWLATSVQVLGSLASNARLRWSPADWGVDEAADPSDDHGWVRRIFFILAKITDFRAAALGQGHRPHMEPERLRQLDEWRALERACDEWNARCPRTMCAMSYLFQSQLQTPSSFPRIWLIKRAAVVGRLFYHISLCVLSQTHPLEPLSRSDEMRSLQRHHAHQICGIVAHPQGQSQAVAPVATRALATAARALDSRAERDEMLDILAQVRERSGWDVTGVDTEVRAAWGWEEEKPRTSKGECYRWGRTVVC